MPKTKAQLRAEAVERLKNTRHHTLSDYVRAMLGWGHEPHFEDCRYKLIDLLTDDCGPCYACAKLAELMAENNALRAANDMKATESDVRTLGVDANDASVDTREKLKADVQVLTERWGRYGGHFMRVYGSVAYAQIIGLLDRQAAITEHTAGIAAKEASKVLRETNADLREDVAERDDVIAVLKAENAELTAERDQWREAAGNAHDMWEEADTERNKLRSEVYRLTRENISLARDLGECMAERDGLRRENAKLSDDEFYLRCTLVDMNGEVDG